MPEQSPSRVEVSASEEVANEVAESSRKLRSARMEEAARLVAEDYLPDPKIADKVGISLAGLKKWKKLPEFEARRKYFVSRYSERALNHGLARQDRRLSILNDIHNRLLRVIEARAEAEELQHIPGGDTGTVTKMLKGIGKGDDFQVVEVYEVDTGILKEIRAIHEQVADELGQRRKKVELSGPGGKPLTVRNVVERVRDFYGLSDQEPA